MTVMKGFMAGIGIRYAQVIPDAVTIVASNRLSPVLAHDV